MSHACLFLLPPETHARYRTASFAHLRSASYLAHLLPRCGHALVVLPRGQRDSKQRLNEFVTVERRVDIALHVGECGAEGMVQRVVQRGGCSGWCKGCRGRSGAERVQN